MTLQNEHRRLNLVKCNRCGEFHSTDKGCNVRSEHIAPVISSAPDKYPLWETADALICPHLRQDIERYVGNGRYQTNWIAKEYDPCPKCNRTNCHNHGKPFHDMNQLTVEKAHCL